MVIIYVLFQTGDIFHIYIKEPTTFFTLYMAMIMTLMVKAVSSARNFYFPNFTCLRQQVQVPVHRCSIISGGSQWAITFVAGIFAVSQNSKHLR